MFVKMFASGTNVQRLAKSASKVNGVLYTSYAEIEQSNEDSNIVHRKFYSTNLLQLKKAVETKNGEVQPSWIKIWGKPNANKSFISSLFKAFVGEESEIPTLNLNQITNDSVSCFMVLTSAYKAETEQIAKIVRKDLPNYEIVILNGDYTTNKKAEAETEEAIARAKIEGKSGVIILSNQMGSRSYSIPQIQATIMAYDRGSVDASQQKVSRSLTPGVTYDGEQKQFGHIIDLSFDPNRSENIERLLIEEIIQVQKSQDLDFPTATSYVLNSINLSKVNEYGYLEEVDEATLFGILGENDNLLRVADISVNVEFLVEFDVFDVLLNVNALGSNPITKKVIAGEDVKNKIKIGSNNKTSKDKKDPAIKQAEQIINEAIKTLNMSATSVYFMTMKGNTYRECVVAANECKDDFASIFGVNPDAVISLLDNSVLNEPILDVIVQNSKKVSSIW